MFGDDNGTIYKWGWGKEHHGIIEQKVMRSAIFHVQIHIYPLESLPIKYSVFFTYTTKIGQTVRKQ